MWAVASPRVWAEFNWSMSNGCSEHGEFATIRKTSKPLDKYYLHAVAIDSWLSYSRWWCRWWCTAAEIATHLPRQHAGPHRQGGQTHNLAKLNVWQLLAFERMHQYMHTINIVCVTMPTTPSLLIVYLFTWQKRYRRLWGQLYTNFLKFLAHDYGWARSLTPVLVM